MNPLLMLLMSMAARRGGQQRTPYGQMSPQTYANRNLTMNLNHQRMYGPGGAFVPGDLQSNSAWTPQSWKFMNYLQNLYWNPGIMGNDTNPIGTQVFGGFYRGNNFDPNNPSQFGPNVGNNTFMQGGNPMNRPAPSPRDLGGYNDYSGFFGGRGGGGGGFIGPYDT